VEAIMKANLSGVLRGALLVVVAALPLLIGGNAMAIEEPSYQVVRTYPGFELRRYKPYIVAETEVSGGFDEVGNQAFSILAGYIFGNNRSKTKIEMTAPVSQQPAGGGERIGMTAPVTQKPLAGSDGNSYIVSFVMPARFTLQNLPEPTDPRVHFREEPARLMAVRRYAGRWTEENYRRNESALLAAVRDAGLKAIGEPIYARYNSPFSLWFLRRNEVMLEVEPTS
jgi:hypothetical protein